ncbi:MAG TPA: nucleotidyltransferase domain-containing protein [Saprospiraceae bacterium]|nr:nucleotidyltransferase domain-containing protein [Saprospiraceae bacterium]HNT20631.1 nucleotidyltransferase domain-containing protein [Saprospiraceae bacterium]
MSILLNQIAECYRYLGPAQHFRANAYSAAAKTIGQMKTSVLALDHDVKKLSQLKIIGESIAENILEYADTGKISRYEELKKIVPVDLLELMQVRGIGPSTIRLLHEKLHINNKEELLKALEENKLSDLENFGPRKIENLKKALKIFKGDRRMPLAEAGRVGKALLEYVLKIPQVERAELAGSLRRRKETVGDIDLVIQAEDRHRNAITNRIVAYPLVAEVIARGPTRVSMVLNPGHVQVDIRVVNKDAFGSSLLYFTGSREHTLQLRRQAQKMGLKLNEYGLFEVGSGKKLAGETEEGVYKALGLEYLEPEERV